MGVSAVVVTRGDVDVQSILDSWPDEWQKLVWDNGSRKIREWSWDQNVFAPHWNEDVSDLAVYGRYAAIEYASHDDVIFVQDDDVIVSDPQAIVTAWEEAAVGEHWDTGVGGFVVCNMPQEFRHDFYSDHALVGFGAAFHRDAPERAFERVFPNGTIDPGNTEWRDFRIDGIHIPEPGFFHRTCDIVFTALTPRVLVDVPKENLPWATDPSRMYHQPEHVGERARMLDLVRQVKGAK